MIDDPKFNEGLDDYKNEFDKALNNNEKELIEYIQSHVDALTGDMLRQSIADADRKAYEAYLQFIDNIKNFVTLYIKALKVT